MVHGRRIVPVILTSGVWSASSANIRGPDRILYSPVFMLVRCVPGGNARHRALEDFDRSLNVESQGVCCDSPGLLSTLSSLAEMTVITGWLCSLPATAFVDLFQQQLVLGVAVGVHEK
ncbi:hypothetical protein NRF20_41770 [Streptomyces sp. R-74717]|uniref:hypothetical protein n=1 Tax=Streptomyces TaxID=1883 RepID=UPI0037B8BCAA